MLSNFCIMWICIFMPLLVCHISFITGAKLIKISLNLSVDKITYLSAIRPMKNKQWDHGERSQQTCNTSSLHSNMCLTGSMLGSLQYMSGHLLLELIYLHIWEIIHYNYKWDTYTPITPFFADAINERKVYLLLNNNRQLVH